MTRTTLLAFATAAVLGASASPAFAASIAINGPTTVQAGDDYHATLAVDPANDAGDPQPVLTVKLLQTACPAGPGLANTFDVASGSVATAAGPQSVPLTFRWTTPGAFTMCVWLASNSVANDAYAAASLPLTVTPPPVHKQAPAITAAWGRTASGRCRVEGDVTPRGSGSVALQRRVGSAWKTVKSARIVDTKFVTTFTARNRDRYRVSFAGGAELLPGVSRTHTIKRTKYGC